MEFVHPGRRWFALPLLLGLALSATASAQEFDSRAYGESVDVTIGPLVGAEVNVSSGPLPVAVGMGPPDYSDSDSLANVTVAGMVQVGIGLQAFELLDTGVLEVNADGTANAASADATVDSLDLSVVGVAILDAVLGIDATVVMSSAQVDGPCGGTLTASGSTTLTGAVASGAIAMTAAVDGAITATPAPNTVLLDVNVAGGNIRVVLNEQIQTGNGTDSLRLVVNAIHVFLTDLPISGLGVVNGQIIVSHSEARISDCGASMPSADLTVTITDSPDPVAVGQILTYTIDVANGGPDGATDVDLQATLPAGVTFVDAVPTQGSCERSGVSLDCDLGDIANAGAATVTVRVIPQAAGMLTVTAQASGNEPDPNTGDNMDSEDSTVVTPPTLADVSVMKSADPEPVAAGGTLTYTIEVMNAGPDAATNVTVVDQLPAGVTFSSAMTSQGTCENNAQIVSCELGNLAAMGVATITIEVEPQMAGVVVNQVEVMADEADPNSGNNVDSATSNVEPGPDGTPAVAIPTLGQFGVLLLLALLSVVGFVVLRRRRGIDRA